MPRILVVEDNRSLATMAKAIIEDSPGFDVSIAASGIAAKELIRNSEEPFSVALVDLNLPDAPNGEIVPVIQDFGIPVIVLTGYFGDELRDKMLELGVVDYVLKKNINTYEYACQLAIRVHRNRSTKVLAVEDSRSALMALTRSLEIQCLEVLSATNGKEALQIFEDNPDIRLVLTDYNMPEMDGFELIQQLRTRHDKDTLAIIGLSSSADSRLSAHFLKCGANDFISKPFGYEELLCRINQNLTYIDNIASIRDAANKDYLTGLFNRRYFYNEGTRHLQQVQFKGLPLSVAIIDIDFFKKINDSYGHEAGDIAIQHLSRIMQDIFPDDLKARLGGEEFCVLMDKPQEQAAKLLETFRARVEASRVASKQHEFKFTVSIGLATPPEKSLDELLRLADANLYLAKEHGRNQLVAS